MTDWQNEPATERQRGYARDLGVTIPNGATKAEASDLISAAMAASRSSRPHNSIAQATAFGSSDHVHAKRGTFDESYFFHPETKRFRFPKYKHEKRFLVRIRDHTDYRSEFWADLDAEERREYSMLDFEMAFCGPELEVEGLETLFYKSTAKHLEPLSVLRGQWGILQSLLEIKDDWFIADHESRVIQTLIDGYLLTRCPSSFEDKLKYFGQFNATELRRVAKAAGVQPGRNKQETIDRMIVSELSFDLPPAVVPHPRLYEWFSNLVELYVDDIKANADRFHPLYIPEIWEAALDANDCPLVETAIKEVIESRYWADRLMSFESACKNR
jgi:hypothetical protein